MNELFMTSLFKRYTGKKNWKSYYDIAIEPESLFSYNREHGDSPCSCENFIEEHFKRGEKTEALDFRYKSIYSELGKHEHTVSLYLLGLHIENLFMPIIKANVHCVIPSSENWYSSMDYMYTWFMAALYHDVASCLEDIKNNCNDSNEMERKIEEFFQDNTDEVHRYSKNIVINYHKYRRNAGRNDHGIAGGLLFHEKMKDIFCCKTNGHDWNKADVMHNEEGNLNWRREHLPHFKYVADAIICHNIWSVQKDDEKSVKKYEHAGLEDLIIKSDKQKLSIDDYPLHFMLCLLDSIEPVKRFSKFSAREVLENVDIDYVQGSDFKSNKKQDYIRISWSEKMKTDLGFWDWMKNIHSLQDWMNVKITSCQCGGLGCSLTIEIMRRDNNRRNKSNI